MVVHILLLSYCANNNIARNATSLIVSTAIHLSVLSAFLSFKQNDSQLKKTSLTVNTASFITLPAKRSSMIANKNKRTVQYKFSKQQLGITKNKQQIFDTQQQQKESENINTKYTPQINLPNKKDTVLPTIELWKVKEALYKNLYFPTIAIRLKQTGITLVAFTILPNGQVAELTVVKSSGYDLLDSAAMKTVENSAKDFPKIATSQKIIVPIEYKLN